jgi:chemotaxis family two-component system sensor kinase Cph1
VQLSDEDLNQCASEPIHIPGSIQPHGCLLAFDSGSHVVVQASFNTEAFLGVAASDLIGRRLSDALPLEMARKVIDALSTPLLAVPVALQSSEVHAALHEQAGITILEVEHATTDSHPPATAIGTALRHLSTIGALDSLLQATVHVVRELSGFDRVVVYRFDEDGHGEVVSEARSEDMPSYLGLHFPESDIPRQARELYLRSWIRAIPDGKYVPVPLLAASVGGTAQPLDLSLSCLRSVSPVHLEYMANMGVQASMSVSLIVQGRLWGLISCGHRQARPMPHTLRTACETIGRLVSLQIGALQALDLQKHQAEKAPGLQRLTERLRDAEGQGLASLAAEPALLMDLAQAQGVAVVSEDSVTCLGSCPDAATVLRLADWLTNRGSSEGCFSTSQLSIDHPQWSTCADIASGILGITLPTPNRHCVIWFRPEVVATVHWGGNPNKPVDGRLHPRHSFDRWKEDVRGRALRWGTAEVSAAAELRRSAIEIDLYRQVQRAQAAVRARDELVAVVAHDLRSPLSVVVMQATVIQRLLAQDPAEKLQRMRVSAQTVQRAGERMSSLLNDLLDLARIEAGRFEIIAVPNSAADIVQDAYELLLPLCEAANIGLVQRVESGLSVLADPERLFQVISNLVGNSVKFSAAGSEIQISVEPLDGLCRFTVTDEGRGISPAELPRIFDRYWQGRPTAATGAGLGLYIAKGIVEAHGGTIWATSEPGERTTVAFTIPLARGQQAQA